MADPIENKIVDKRVAHRYLRKGKLDEKTYESHLRALPDLADQALPVEASISGVEEPDDLDEVEEAQAQPAAEGGDVDGAAPQP